MDSCISHSKLLVKWAWFRVQHGHEYAEWKWTCTIGMNHRHGHAAWTRTGNRDMDTQQGHEQAACPWTCRTDIDK
jgi:hypothetical protein